MASHRLIQHIGKLYGLRVSEGLYDRLNVYYFVDGHSLNDQPLLAEVAAEELTKLLPSNEDPMTKEDIMEFLQSQQGRNEIENALKMLRRLDIHSIPKFILEGTTLVDGAADWRLFVEIFEEIEERGYVQNNSVFGALLGVSEDQIQNGAFRSLEDLEMAV